MTFIVTLEDVFPKWSSIIYRNESCGFFGAPGQVTGYYKGKVKVRLQGDYAWSRPRVLHPRFLYPAFKRES